VSWGIVRCGAGKHQLGCRPVEALGGLPHPAAAWRTRASATGWASVVPRGLARLHQGHQGSSAG
jgi:hypothetical protein